MTNNLDSFKNICKNSTCKNYPLVAKIDKNRNGYSHKMLEENKEIQYAHVDHKNSMKIKTENEEVKLKEIVDKRLYEISLLRQIKKTKDMKIAVINREIELMKTETPNLEQEIELYDRSHVRGLETLSSSSLNQFELQILRQTKKVKDKKIEAMNEEMQLIKTTSKSLACQIDLLTNQLEDKVTNFCKQSPDYPMTTNKTDVHSRSDTDSISGPINRILFWPVNKVHKMREEGKLIASEFFYPENRPYKLCLSLGSYGDKLEIRLLCYSSSVDSNLTWPFQADISIRIINGVTPGTSRHITKFRQFSRPPKGLFQSSDRFTFSFPELASAGLLKGDCFILECLAKLK